MQIGRARIQTQTLDSGAFVHSPYAHCLEALGLSTLV